MRDRCLETQRFLHQIRPGNPALDHVGALPRAGQQREDSLVEQVDRRLVPSVDDQHQRVDEFLLGQLRAVVLVAGGDQHAGDVIARFLPPVCHEFTDESIHFEVVGLGLLGRERAVEEPVDTFVHSGAQVVRHAHQLGDDLDRDRVCESLTQVDHYTPRGRRQLVQQVVGDRLDPRTQRGGATVSERRRNQFPQAAMVRTVRGEHVVRRHPGCSGQSCVISPFTNAAQCCRGSFDTRGSANRLLSTTASVTDHAGTPPGNSTRVTGPRSRIRTDSPWMSVPVVSRAIGSRCIGRSFTACSMAETSGKRPVMQPSPGGTDRAARPTRP